MLLPLPAWAFATARAAPAVFARDGCAAREISRLAASRVRTTLGALGTALGAPAVAADASLCVSPAPCEFDLARFVGDLVASPGGICFLVYAAYRVLLASRNR